MKSEPWWPASASLHPQPRGRLRRQLLHPEVREANRAIQAVIGRDSLASFVDVARPMLGHDGQPRPELFLRDNLHVNRTGYLLWRRLLIPRVK
jgi:hypothetical protein